jgi:S-adenosylmethionine decarboxylase
VCTIHRLDLFLPRILIDLTSESSLFISPHRLILKTCGTTLNLYGLPRILEIARDFAGLDSVYQFFYSRKSFMFPERQLGPHRDWRTEVEYLDAIFKDGAAYTVGKVNGDHWLLYMVSPNRDSSLGKIYEVNAPPSSGTDYTIEIMMTHLHPSASQHFHAPASVGAENDNDNDLPPGDHGAQELSQLLGISSLFPPQLTTLDAYTFFPCGYSSNALLKWGNADCADSPLNGEGYYTIHVTPEGDWSYASFECNVPLSTTPSHQQSSIPDLKTLVRRVVSIFKPGKLSLTLFISNDHDDSTEEEDCAIEAAQRAFRAALTTHFQASPDDTSPPVYKRTDKINYEFGAYDLAFATFELSS